MHNVIHYYDVCCDTRILIVDWTWLPLLLLLIQLMLRPRNGVTVFVMFKSYYCSKTPNLHLKHVQNRHTYRHINTAWFNLCLSLAPNYICDIFQAVSHISIRTTRSAEQTSMFEWHKPNFCTTL